MKIEVNNVNGFHSIEYIETAVYDAEFSFDKKEFERSKDTMASTLKHCVKVAKEHDVKGLKCWIDWNDFRLW